MNMLRRIDLLRGIRVYNQPPTNATNDPYVHVASLDGVATCPIASDKEYQFYAAIIYRIR